MSAAEDRADDVRRQHRETKELRRIGRNDAFGFGDILGGSASVGEELVPDRIGTDEKTHKAGVAGRAITSGAKKPPSSGSCPAGVFTQSSPNSSRCLEILGAKKRWGSGMRRFRRLSADETELGHRTAPGEVLAERDAAWAAELTPNIVVLGDPLPGRSALDAKHRTSPR